MSQRSVAGSFTDNAAVGDADRSSGSSSQLIDLAALVAAVTVATEARRGGAGLRSHGEFHAGIVALASGVVPETVVEVAAGDGEQVLALHVAVRAALPARCRAGVRSIADLGAATLAHRSVPLAVIEVTITLAGGAVRFAVVEASVVARSAVVPVAPRGCVVAEVLVA